VDEQVLKNIILLPLSTGIYCNIMQMTQRYNVIYETK